MEWSEILLNGGIVLFALFALYMLMRRSLAYLFPKDT